MNEQLTQVGEKFGISANDLQIIYDCVSAFPKNDLSAHIHLIERYFLTDIKPVHYSMLGYLVGYLNGAENSFSQFYTNLSLCQRQN